MLIGEAGIRAPPRQASDKKGFRLLSGPGGEVRRITHEVCVVGFSNPRAHTQNLNLGRLLHTESRKFESRSEKEHTQQMGSLCYSLNLSPAQHHPGYERVLLSEVSAELLHVHDAQDAEEGLVDAEGLLVAVSFRRR